MFVPSIGDRLAVCREGRHLRRMNALIPALIGAGGVALGIVLSWVLNQASAYLTTERERRARIRGVLAELLEIRHTLLVQPKLTNPVDVVLRFLPPALQATATLPTEARQAVEGLWAQLAPDSSALEQRYERAVAALAELDPVLSYQLRGKAGRPTIWRCDSGGSPARNGTSDSSSHGAPGDGRGVRGRA